MFASYDMNPMAIRQMQQERLAADIAHADRSARWEIRAGGVIVALVIATVVLF